MPSSAPFSVLCLFMPVYWPTATVAARADPSLPSHPCASGPVQRSIAIDSTQSCPVPSAPGTCTRPTGSCEQPHYGQLVVSNGINGSDADDDNYNDGALGEDDGEEAAFPCNEELVTATTNADGTSAAEERFTYCCDIPVEDATTLQERKFRGSNLLFAEEYRERFIAGKTFHCEKGVTEEEGGITVIKQIPRDGHYTLYIQSNINVENPTAELIALSGYVKFISLSGFLAAAQYPLMVFYGTMGLCYLFLGMGWITAMALHFQDLLRLQVRLRWIYGWMDGWTDRWMGGGGWMDEGGGARGFQPSSPSAPPLRPPAICAARACPR